MKKLISMCVALQPWACIAMMPEKSGQPACTPVFRPVAIRPAQAQSIAAPAAINSLFFIPVQSQAPCRDLIIRTPKSIPGSTLPDMALETELHISTHRATNATAPTRATTASPVEQRLEQCPYCISDAMGRADRHQPASEKTAPKLVKIITQAELAIAHSGVCADTILKTPNREGTFLTFSLLAHHKIRLLHEILRQNPALINQTTIAGRCHGAENKTLLHAAAAGHEHQPLARIAITLLCAHGANPDAQNADGQTPLHIAVLLGRNGWTALLIAANANPLIPDNKGQTALELARTSPKISEEIKRLIAAQAEKFRHQATPAH